MPYSRHILPLLVKYCTDCGGSATPAGRSAHGPARRRKGEALGCQEWPLLPRTGGRRHACRERPARRAQRCVCALALGLVLAFGAGSAAAERTGLQREIRETREIRRRDCQSRPAGPGGEPEGSEDARQRGAEPDCRRRYGHDIAAGPPRCRHGAPACHDTGKPHRATRGDAASARGRHQSACRGPAGRAGDSARRPWAPKPNCNSCESCTPSTSISSKGCDDLQQRRGGAPGVGRGAARPAALEGRAAHDS